MVNPPRAQPARRRTLLRRILRVALKGLAWVLGILTGLSLLAWLAILIFFPDDEIRRMALDEISARTGLHVSAGELDLDILSGLVLEDVRLAPPPGFERAPLTIERVVMDYSLADLLDDRLQVRKLTIEGARVFIGWRSGRSNLEALVDQVRSHLAAIPAEATGPEPAGAEAPFQIDLEQVELQGASLEVDAPGSAGAKLEGLCGGVRGLLAGPRQSRLEIALKLAPDERQAVWLSQAGPRASLGLDVEATVSGLETIRASALVRLRAPRPEAPSGAVPIDLLARLGLEIDLTRHRLLVDPLRVELDGDELITARAELPDWSAGLGYRLAVERLHLGHPTLAGLARLDPSVGRGVWIRGGSASGDLRALSASDAQLPISFEDLGFETRAAKLSGARGLLRLRLEAAPGGGRRAVLEGELRVARAGVGPVWVEAAAVYLSLEAALDPNRPSALGRSALGLRASADRLSLAGFRLTRPKVRIDASAADLVASEAGGSLKAPDLRLQVSADRATGGGLGVSRPALDLRASGTEQRLAARFGKPLRVHARLTSNQVAPLPGGRLAIPEGSRLESIGLSIDTRLAGIAPERLPLAVRLDIDRPRVGRGPDRPAWQVAGSVGAQWDGRLHTQALRLDLDRFHARVADLLALEATGWVDARAPAMQVRFDTSEHSLAALVAALPEDIRVHVPPLTGKVRLAGRFDGPLRVVRDHRRLPFSVDLTVHNIDVSFAEPRSGLRLTGLSGPVRLSAGPAFDQQVLSTASLKLARAGLGDGALTGEGLQVELASKLQGDQLSADGWMTAERARVGDAWPRPIERVRLDFASLLTGFKDLRLTDFSLVLGSAGISSSGQGQILITPGSGHIGPMRLVLQTRSRFSSNQAVALPGGLSARGKAELSLGLRSEQGGLLRADGRIAFDGFTLSGPGFGLKGAEGAIPVLQYLKLAPQPALLARSDGPRPAAAGARSTAYDQALRPLKGQARSFSIARMRLKDLIFTELSGNLELAGGALSLGSLRFGFLGGDVVADTTAVFAPPERRRLELDAEMSGIDLSGLGALNLAGTSDVSGNLRLTLDWKQRDLTTAFNLTRIGRSTLQALLVALDPDQANPGLVAFRGFLDRYEVSPREVNLDMRHGLLSMRTRLEMGPLARAAAGFVQGFSGDTFALSHIPVGNILSKYMTFGE